MRHSILAAALVLTPLALGGCTTPEASDVEHHADRPDCMDEATRLEDMAHKEVRLGVNRTKKDKTAEHFDTAMDLLRQARQLYEDELVAAKGTPESQHSCRVQIERINDEITRLSAEKPQ